MSLSKSDIIPPYCIGEDLHSHIIEILPTSRETAPPKVTSPNDFSKRHGGLEPQSQSTCTFHSVYLFRHYATFQEGLNLNAHCYVTMYACTDRESNPTRSVCCLLHSLRLSGHSRLHFATVQQVKIIYASERR